MQVDPGHAQLPALGPNALTTALLLPATQLGAAGRKLQCCSACKQAWYCSQECQKRDWGAGHKKVCSGRKAAAAAPAGSGST
jgi:hypothetical protein